MSKYIYTLNKAKRGKSYDAEIAKVTIQRVNVNTFSLSLSRSHVKPNINTPTLRKKWFMKHKAHQNKIVIEYMDKGQLNQNQKKKNNPRTT